MKRFLVILISVISLQGLAQTVEATQELLQGYDKIPLEEIFVHQNSNVLLAGEYLFYKVYCKNKQTGQMSTLSKVAYVELIDRNKEVVFKHKIRLNDGVGQGDFFIPVGTPSGSYKLVAYTQWMRNGGTEQLFQSDVAVINPYQNAQEDVLASDNNNSLTLINPIWPSQNTVNSAVVQLVTDERTYGKREKVEIEMRGISEDIANGTYSLSVHKIDMVAPFDAISSVNYAKSTSGTLPPLGTSIFLPELRGEMVWGNVIKTSNGTPAPKTKVALSIPGQDFVTKIANTNNEGNFYFVLQDEFAGADATFQVLGDTISNYSIKVGEHTPLNYDGLQFASFSIDESLKETLLERSVYNQIENGYYEMKPDTVKVPLASPPFYGLRGKAYNLDDYKRFNSVQETFLEFIDDAWTKKEEGETVFTVRSYENTLPSNFPPLIIMDGIILQEEQKLLDYPARKIKTISIVRDKYYLGADVFQGVIIVETLTGDFYESLNEGYVSKVNLFTAEPEKSYFQQQYDGDNDKRIPDFRSQLLWEPNAEMNADGSWDFYTSDNTGVYEISLEGFSATGKPVSSKQYIIVK